jgi:hypothetical protein
MIWKYGHCLAECNCVEPHIMVNFTTLVPYQKVGVKEDYEMMDKVLNILKSFGFKGSVGVMIESHYNISKEKIIAILNENNIFTEIII